MSWEDILSIEDWINNDMFVKIQLEPRHSLWTSLLARNKAWIVDCYKFWRNDLGLCRTPLSSNCESHVAMPISTTWMHEFRKYILLKDSSNNQPRLVWKTISSELNSSMKSTSIGDMIVNAIRQEMLLTNLSWQYFLETQILKDATSTASGMLGWNVVSSEELMNGLTASLIVMCRVLRWLLGESINAIDSTLNYGRSSGSGSAIDCIYIADQLQLLQYAATSHVMQPQSYRAENGSILLFRANAYNVTHHLISLITTSTTNDFSLWKSSFSESIQSLTHVLDNLNLMAMTVEDLTYDEGIQVITQLFERIFISYGLRLPVEVSVSSSTFDAICFPDSVIDQRRRLLSTQRLQKSKISDRTIAQILADIASTVSL